ncbi:hypothetical protein LPJ53_001301 [Coemansia erecta]|uniref:Transcription initiation factor TFIID subunit 4 n=1 Tax=Coemansia erecta TaxID=147472 RepID=A0A9W7Y4D3_9FUNG|nr:hypothetical protein LPJ53_001301 [Coemansia erecta]
MAGAAASPLLALFGSDVAASVGTPQAGTPIDLSGLLPVSGLSGSSGATTGALTPLPLDADIDQLMKSLGDNVDATKVSDEDLDKLLGSISAGFSSGMPSAPVASGSSGSDALAALSRDFGIDLSTPVAMRGSAAGGPLGDVAGLAAGGSAFTPTPIAHSNSAVVAGSTPVAGPATASLSARPGQFSAMGQQQQLAMRPVAGRPPHPPSSHQPQQQHQQHRPVSAHSTPQHTPLLGVGPGRPAGGQPQHPQQRTASASGVTTPVSTGASTPTPSAHPAQRPPRPQNMAAAPRPGARPGRPMHAMQQAQQSHQQQPGVRAPGVRPGVRPAATEPSRWLANIMAALPPEQQERLAGLFRGLQTRTLDYATFARDAEAIIGPRFQSLLAIMRSQSGPPAGAAATRLPHPMQVQQPPPPRAVRPTAGDAQARPAAQHQPRPMHHMQLPHAAHVPLDVQALEAQMARWRQVITSPTVSSELLARLSLQFSAYGESLGAGNGDMAGLPEEARAQLLAQVARLQALIAQRQLGGTAAAAGPALGAQPESRAASPEARRRGRKKAGRPKRRGDAAGDAPAAKRARAAGSDGASDAEADTPAASSDESDADADADAGPVAQSPAPASRRPTKPARERERERSNGGGGGDAFSIDDVIGYTGVDLRAESEIILGGVAPHARVRARADDAAHRTGTRLVGGVHVAFDADLLAAAGLAPGALAESVVARACAAARIAHVAADVVPVLALALHERLRAHLELATAAAQHRARTQTLPPPPLDPATRQPMYKIAAHQDVRRQLAAVERRDRLRDQAREARVRERENAGDAAAAAGDSVAAAAASVAEDAAGDETAPAEDATGQPARRSRKREEAVPTAAYTSKNMPDDLRNKISNQTALRAAGAVRKAWMSAAPAGDSDMPATPLSSSSSAVAAAAVAGAPAPGTARATPLAGPLMLTVRDCLFSLERERVGRVRVGRGGGGRVLQQAYVRHLGE